MPLAVRQRKKFVREFATAPKYRMTKVDRKKSAHAAQALLKKYGISQGDVHETDRSF